MTVRRIPSKRSKTMQYVKVDLDGKAYTYRWTGVEPLKRGDRVEVPANVVNPKPSIRTVLRLMPGPDYDVDKIVNILSKVEGGQPSRYCHEAGCARSTTSHLWDAEICPTPAVERALDGLDRDEARRMHVEPHDWDDLIGDDTAVEKFEDYVAEQAHAARERRNDDWVTYGSMGGTDPSADDLPEDAARMMQARYADALPDDLIGDPYGEDWGDYGYPNAHEEGDRS